MALSSKTTTNIMKAIPPLSAANSGSLHQIPVAGKAEAFTFIGWNTKADGSGQSYTAGNTFDVTVDIALYTEWGPYQLRDTGPYFKLRNLSSFWGPLY